MKKDKIIILAGMPGAGKGAISTIMKWQPNITHISTGDLFRKLDPESELGKKVAAIQAAGKLVDDDTVNEMVLPKLVHNKDILLDGFPRSIPQAEWLLGQVADTFDVVSFLLEIDERTAEFRREKRINDCIQRGEQPRKDDLDPAVMPKRFLEYKEKTEPTIDFLKQNLKDRFFSINGSVTIEDVYDSIMKILSSL